MSGAGSLVGLGGSFPPVEPANPQRVKEVAREFESLLIAQLMRGMRGGEEQSWFGASTGQSAGALSEFAEQVVARTLASSGGLGLASLVAQGLLQSDAASEDQAQKLNAPA
jgi:Rod binding domain-containing protein